MDSSNSYIGTHYVIYYYIKKNQIDKMITINNPADCCGCTACASICAHDAITMKPDALGFLYPEVDEDKCVDCGLCEKVCAFNDHYDTSLNLEKPLAYGARHKDMNEVETSRSGAAFIAISDYILEQGGVVYGAGYADHFRVVHKRATTKEERDEFKGSKYVQSDMTGVFRQVRQDLRDGLTVLFSGTPCQTAGLNKYVGKKLRENLILLDIICHAVPSPYIWRDYLASMEKKARSKAKAIYFRDKTYGWAAQHNERFVFKSGKESVDYIHRDLFYENFSTRISCHSCHFCNLFRPSDITIGDFWGYDKTDCKSMNEDGRGISLLLINTAKGHKLLDAIRDSVILKQVPLSECLQPNLQRPTSLNPLRYQFIKDYTDKGFMYVAKKYSDWSLKKRIIRNLRAIKKHLKGIVK